MIEMIDNFLRAYIGWILLVSWIIFGLCMAIGSWEWDD